MEGTAPRVGERLDIATISQGLFFCSEAMLKSHVDFLGRKEGPVGPRRGSCVFSSKGLELGLEF